MSSQPTRFLCITVAAMFAATAALAQDTGARTVEQFACKDVMRDSGRDRDVAIAFLHGYILGKSGASKFDVEALRKQTELFIDRCLNNPNDRALDIMLKVKS